MKTTFKSSSLSTSSLVGPGGSAKSEIPYTLVDEAQRTVGAVLLALNTPVVNTEQMMILCNRSAAGANNIRVGVAPAFGPPAFGFLLEPGDAITIPDTQQAHFAIADGAGRLLDILIYQRTII